MNRPRGWVVYENPGGRFTPPVNPDLRVIEREGATVVPLFQEELAFFVGELLNGRREIGVFVQGIVAEGFRRQSLEALYGGMEGLKAYVLTPDDEDLHAAHVFEGHLRLIAGAWFVALPGAEPYRIISSDAIYVAPHASS